MSNNTNKISTTVDEKDKEVFKKCDKIWWNGGRQLKGLHTQVKIIVPFIYEQLAITGLIKKELLDTPEPLKELQILEVGCGGGILSEGLAKTGCNLVATDINEVLLDVAKEHSGNDSTFSKLSYILEAIEEHCEKYSEKYDALVSNYVLDHVNDHEYS